MKRYFIIFVLFLTAAACSKEEGRVDIPELGVKEESFTLDCAPGECFVDVLSDGEFTASIDGTAEWLRFKKTQTREYAGKNDERICVQYDFNRGTDRKATISVSRGNKTILVDVFQQGVIPSEISLSRGSIKVGENGGAASINVVSVYKTEDLDISVEYEGVAGWITEVEKINGSLGFVCMRNDEALNRVARIRVRLKSDHTVEGVLQVVQYGKDCVPEEKSFQEIKSLLESAGTIEIQDNWELDAIVCGDDAEGNGGENANISSIMQDLTLSSRTAYIQNSDASSGIKLIFDDGENITRRYDAVRILLKGVRLSRLGGTSDNPVRYEIGGLKSSNVLSSVSGSEYDLISKEKCINELTDDDVYTFVTIKDCEIPVRKGPFAPIDLRLTSLIHSYPMVLRDKSGDNIYLMTNLSASWQRDGNPMPQGAGTVSGVIVHETCDNFEWDTEEQQRQIREGVNADYVTGIGNIGAYQIRPFQRKDIRIADDFNEGFSGLLMEIRYYNKDNDNIIKNVSGNTVFSTYPPVQDPLTDGEIRGTFSVMEGNPGKQAGVAVWRDWTHLGPMAGAVITDPFRGNGVYDANGNPIEWSPTSNVTTTGLIMNASGWYAGSHWGPTKYWMASFRTTATAAAPALTASNFPLSIQFGVVSGLGQNVGAPRYWCVEYRTAEDGDWIEVGMYTVPDFPILSNRKSWQCPGPKYVSFTLPEDDDLLDNDNVCVRLRPVSTEAGSADSYDGAERIEGRQTELNYFAVRYNK